MKKNVLALICLLITAGAAAQQNTPAPAPAAATTKPLTLEQMEAIYQRELSSRHIPLISRYLQEIQRLQAASTDPKPYLDEIASVILILKANGVIDLQAARAATTEGAPSTAPTAMPMSAAAPVTPIREWKLLPAQALQATPAAETAKIGRIEWKAPELPAGTYDVHIEYSATGFKTPIELELALGSQNLTSRLPTVRATKNEKTFGVFKIGRMKLTAAVSGQTLSLTAGTATDSGLVLRQLLLTPAKEPPPAP
jgi:hypothetical protein